MVSRRLKCYVAFAVFYCLDNSLCVRGFILVKPVWNVNMVLLKPVKSGNSRSKCLFFWNYKPWNNLKCVPYEYFQQSSLVMWWGQRNLPKCVLHVQSSTLLLLFLFYHFHYQCCHVVDWPSQTALPCIDFIEKLNILMENAQWIWCLQVALERGSRIKRIQFWLF